MLLHGYELGVLTEEEIERFEIHLIECSFCRAEMQSGAEIAEAAPSVNARLMAMQSSPEANTERRPAHGPRALRWLAGIAAALALALVYPAYQGLFQKSGQEQRVITIDAQVSLLSTRSGTGIPIVRGDQSTAVTFGFPRVVRDRDYRLELYRDDEVKPRLEVSEIRFDESGVAVIVFAPGMLDPGKYRLHLTDAIGAGEWEDIHFKVE
jgi:hypothetical protein